jgi:hypothetical protein
VSHTARGSVRGSLNRLDSPDHRSLADHGFGGRQDTQRPLAGAVNSSCAFSTVNPAINLPCSTTAPSA